MLIGIPPISLVMLSNMSLSEGLSEVLFPPLPDLATVLPSKTEEERPLLVCTVPRLKMLLFCSFKYGVKRRANQGGFGQVNYLPASRALVAKSWRYL